MQDIAYISRLLNVSSSTLRNHTASGYPSPLLLDSSVSTSLSYQHLLPVVAMRDQSLSRISLLSFFYTPDLTSFFSKWIVFPLCSIFIIEPHALTRNKRWSLYWLKQKRRNFYYFIILLINFSRSFLVCTMDYICYIAWIQSSQNIVEILSVHQPTLAKIWNIRHYGWIVYHFWKYFLHCELVKVWYVYMLHFIHRK